jgi:uncharacterized protein involved in exopolysaccharide biosynthesis
MRDQHNAMNSERLSFTLRDLISIAYRQKRILALSFSGMFIGVITAALLFPAEYEASTKFLVKHERMDPVVSPEQNASVLFRDTVGEEEINSEVELIQSSDVLRNVVLECALDQHHVLMDYFRKTPGPQERVERAIRRLRSSLQVDAVKKTTLIEVSYTSTDPQLAANVLKSLNKFYLAKHMEVNHPSGQLAFFEKETEEYKKDLAESEKHLKDFSVEQGGVAPQVQRDLTLQKFSEFSASLEQTRAEIASTEKRVQDLHRQAGSTPARLTTQTRKADNPQVLEQLKGTLLTLELKRTELLTKYQPTYPLVQEVDKQLAETRTAIVNEQSLPIREETMDQNPTYAWVASELAKAEADLSGLRARQVATQAVVALYADKARELEQKGIMQQDLLRQEKADEENYLLYLHKREESRIGDALDQTHILNVVTAQEPMVPALPTRSAVVFGFIGILLAGVVSMGLAFAVDCVDQSFRTPSEVVSELNIPVLAAVPSMRTGTDNADWPRRNGNGNSGYRGNGTGYGEDADIHGVAEPKDQSGVYHEES